MKEEKKVKELKKLSELNVGFWIHEKALVRTDSGWKFPHELSKKESLVICKEQNGKLVFSSVIPLNKYKIPYKGKLLGRKLYQNNTAEIDCDYEETDDIGTTKKRKSKLKTNAYSGDILFKPADNLVGSERFNVRSLIDSKSHKTKEYDYDGYLYGFDVSPIVAYEFILEDNELTNIEYAIVKSV